MTHNDVLRSLRYLLETDDSAIAAIIALGGGTTSRPEVTAFMEREDAPGYVLCSDSVIGQFLDGLIIQRRGRDEHAPPRAPEARVTNNTVLKKLRVAFELKEDDLLALMAQSGFEVTRPELSALFRKPEHRNFKPAGDQFLRNFLKALTARIRG
jgi:uncharacterized protein YehS (DUF1456 family)